MNLGLRTDRHVAQNLLIYLSFLLIAWIGSLYGNAISGDHAFLRVWQVDNILILLLGLPFLLLQGKVDAKGAQIAALDLNASDKQNLKLSGQLDWSEGLSAEQAYQLAVATFSGASSLAAASTESPEVLRGWFSPATMASCS